MTVRKIAFFCVLILASISACGGHDTPPAPAATDTPSPVPTPTFTLQPTDTPTTSPPETPMEQTEPLIGMSVSILVAYILAYALVFERLEAGTAILDIAPEPVHRPEKKTPMEGIMIGGGGAAFLLALWESYPMVFGILLLLLIAGLVLQYRLARGQGADTQPWRIY